MKKKRASGSKQASALVIGKESTGKLSADQSAFNRLTARIEKLRTDIERKERQLEKAVLLYGREVPPLEAQKRALLGTLLMHLMPLYRLGKMPKTRKASFKKMLQEMLVETVQESTEAPDDAMKAIFRELMGEDYERMKQREAKQLQQEIREELKRRGMNPDWDEDTVLTEAALREKIQDAYQRLAAKQENAREAHQSHSGKRSKTARQSERQLQAQAAETGQQKSISTIYRQLVKLFHPDLERDEARRVEKEALMKELTGAYEARNLHKLLQLELEWIHKENNHLGSLTEEKLQLYLEQLRRQATQLESEKYQLVYQPRFMALTARFNLRDLMHPEKVVRDEIAHLKEEIDLMETDIEMLEKEDRCLAYAKRMVHFWEARNEDNWTGEWV